MDYGNLENGFGRYSIERQVLSDLVERIKKVATDLVNQGVPGVPLPMDFETLKALTRMKLKAEAGKPLEKIEMDWLDHLERLAAK